MPMTPEEFAVAVKSSCPQCAAGNEPRWRSDTSEFVHDYGSRASFSHVFCLATGLLKNKGSLIGGSYPKDMS